MNIFDFQDYKTYINDYVSSLPNLGRGEYGRIAKAASISSTLVSQVFKGERELTLDQAFLIAEYLNLNSDEGTYFELLVLKQRSGIKRKSEMYQAKIIDLQKKNKSFKKHIKPKKLELTQKEEIKYYTEWLHSALRLISEIKGYQHIEEISLKLKIDLNIIKESAEFLSKVGLVEYNNGVVRGLKKNIHQEKSSPLDSLRQQTWRMKALENFQRKKREDYFFNALMTINSKQIDEIKEILQSSVGLIGKQVGQTTVPDEMMCLNIDFFEI